MLRRSRYANAFPGKPSPIVFSFNCPMVDSQPQTHPMSVLNIPPLEYGDRLQSF
jgi:hypothetical protein